MPFVPQPVPADLLLPRQLNFNLPAVPQPVPADASEVQLVPFVPQPVPADLPLPRQLNFNFSLDNTTVQK